MTLSTSHSVLRSVVALGTAMSLVFAGATAAAAPTGSAVGHSSSAQPVGEQVPVPTTAQLNFLSDQLGPAAGEIERAQQGDSSEGEVRSVALPIAAAAVAAAAWCASGALGSVPTSVLDDLTNGGAGTDYARNAIIGCLAGNVGSWAWKVLPGWAKEKAIAAVAAFIIKYVR